MRRSSRACRVSASSAYDAAARSNFQYVVVEIDGRWPIARDRLLDVLWAENVIARRYFYPGCHRMEPYRTTDPDAARLLPETEKVAARVLVLPTGQTVTEDQIGRLCDIIRLAISNGPAITRRLQGSAALHDDILTR